MLTVSPSRCFGALGAALAATLVVVPAAFATGTFSTAFGEIHYAGAPSLYMDNMIASAQGGKPVFTREPGGDELKAGTGCVSLVLNDAVMCDAQSFSIDLGSGADRFVATSTFPIGGTILGGTYEDLIVGGPKTDVIDGGDQNDQIDGGGGADALKGGAGIDTVDWSGREAPVSATFDGAANDGYTAELDNLAADIEVIRGGVAGDDLRGDARANTFRGGAGADVLSGGEGADELKGEAGNDTITGGPGKDLLDGGSEDDVIDARDGVADTVNCATGKDRAIVDELDVTADCETVELPAPPAAPAEAATTTTTTTDSSVPGSGTTGTGGVSTEGEHRATPPVLHFGLQARYVVRGSRTRVRRLVATGLPAGATIAIRCKGRGCPKAVLRAAVRSGSSAVLTSKLRRHVLRPGATVDVVVTAPSITTAQRIRLTVRKGRAPRRTIVA